MIPAEKVVIVVQRHHLSPKAGKWLFKYARLEDQAPIHEILGVRISELPRLNDAMADVRDMRKMAGVR